LEAFLLHLFAKHLDLSGLRASRGRVVCIFCPDKSKPPALSLDLDRGLFHCFRCGVGGGVLAFARLVGE
jgi:hypothetical protein